MADAFEPTREAIRQLQARLRGEEDYRSEALEALLSRAGTGEITATEFWAWDANLRTRIEIVEREIVRLMQRIPPHAVARDGYIELLPVWEVWQMPNPRAVV